ncbi:MAG: DMT family transporter [Alphaproteobacteria bacterium]|nr:MAG: DMT family transporter [Alphaproteobacteria bacterium]
MRCPSGLASPDPFLNVDASKERRVAPKNIVRVVLWMSGALLLFSAMAVSVRVLAATLGVMEILALRAGLGLMVMAALAALRADLRATINCRHLPLQLLRNTVHLGASYLWATSLLLIPLATAFALEFTTPAWTLLLAAPVLGERLTASRIGAVVFGLLGVLVILRPGLATFQPGALLTLVAAFGLAIALIATKKLTRTDSTFAIVFWMMLIQLPLALAGSDPLFVTKLNQGQVPAVIGIGVTGLLSHYCLTNAFRAGDAGVVVPLDFMRIPLIAVIGWWLYGERLDVFVFLGAGLIITGVLWNLRSEAARVQGSEH